MKGIGLHKYWTGDRFVWTLNKRGGNDWLTADPDKNLNWIYIDFIEADWEQVWPQE